MSQRSIILKRIPYGDSDLIVTYLTQFDGKMRGIAKGARVSKRRFGPTIQNGAVLDLNFRKGRGSNLSIILDAEPVHMPLNSSTTLKNLSYLLSILELIDLFLPEEVPVPSKFELAQDELRSISENGYGLTDYLIFQTRWLKESGFGPWRDVCMRCGCAFDGRKWCFCHESSGFLCENCLKPSHTHFVSHELMNLLCNIEHLKSEGISARSAFEADRLLKSYCEYVLGKPLRARNISVDMMD